MGVSNPESCPSGFPFSPSPASKPRGTLLLRVAHPKARRGSAQREVRNGLQIQPICNQKHVKQCQTHCAFGPSFWKYRGPPKVWTSSLRDETSLRSSLLRHLSHQNSCSFTRCGSENRAFSEASGRLASAVAFCLACCFLLILILFNSGGLLLASS